ncbi:MAG TPA: NAD(P)-binding domain-containing protein [Ktedonobacterales bacterium]|jgi:putative flavoprotein involved in K+ transport
MPHPDRIDTLIVGAGQAGLATSYWLTQYGYPHLVLEQAAIPGHVWRDDRWDSFTLNTPNWMTRLPGAPYHGDAPDAYLPRDEIVALFADYAARFHLPIHFGARGLAVEPAGDGARFRVQTETAQYEADNVVVASGLYQRPRVPDYHASLPAAITQLTTSTYRHPESLPPGAVLVVGSARSGCQIAEELYQSGRQVYLCVSRAGRLPRRYRGLDSLAWRYLIGEFDRPVSQLKDPAERFAANPHISGRDGGHTINLHRFARAGVTLLGRLRGANDGRLALAPDLRENLVAADNLDARFRENIDRFVEQAGIDVPQEDLPSLTDGFAQMERTELDLAAADIRTVIWAIGYTYDFSLIKFPVFDATGYPVQLAGITHCPGLYFVGLPWLRTHGSGLLYGVGDDAAWIATDISRRSRQRTPSAPSVATI